MLLSYQFGCVCMCVTIDREKSIITKFIVSMHMCNTGDKKDKDMNTMQ